MKIIVTKYNRDLRKAVKVDAIGKKIKRVCPRSMESMENISSILQSKIFLMISVLKMGANKKDFIGVLVADSKRRMIKTKLGKVIENRLLYYNRKHKRTFNRKRYRITGKVNNLIHVL